MILSLSVRHFTWLGLISTNERRLRGTEWGEWMKRTNEGRDEEPAGMWWDGPGPSVRPSFTGLVSRSELSHHLPVSLEPNEASGRGRWRVTKGDRTDHERREADAIRNSGLMSLPSHPISLGSFRSFSLRSLPLLSPLDLGCECKVREVTSEPGTSIRRAEVIGAWKRTTWEG